MPAESTRSLPAGRKPSAVETYLLGVISGRPGTFASCLRVLLACLAPLYSCGLAIFLLPYSIGIRKRTRLACPVICVGNLTTGGTGKTPMTQLVCRLLQDRGLRPVVLSRGYGGANEYGCAVVSDGSHVLLDAAMAGDEAYLLAVTLPGIPVLVGKDRRKTGAAAVSRFNPDVVVLDDGMQFWQLHRDLDMVLLASARPFDNGYTFPRGLLREPKTHLRRAGAVVLTSTRDLSVRDLEHVENEIKPYAGGAPIFSACLVPQSLRNEADKVEYTTAWLSQKRVASVCAIGNPASFEAMLESLCAAVEPRFRYRDHQAIQEADLQQIYSQAADGGAEALVTTAKDAARVDFSGAPLPVLVLQVSMQVDDEERFIALLLDAIRRDRPHAGA